MMDKHLFEIQSKGRALRKPSKVQYFCGENLKEYMRSTLNSRSARNEAGTLFYRYEDVKDMIKDNKTFKQAYNQAKNEGLDKFCFQGVWVDATLPEDEAFKQFRNSRED